MAKYEVIVIGGGHSGAEAAKAAADFGAKTLLLTTSLDTIGLIAGSPSFGGPGRGQLLKQIDASGGLMPQIVDAAGIYFRADSNGEPFVICERSYYSILMKSHLETIDNLGIKQDIVIEINNRKDGWQAITTTGQQFEAKSIVVGTGTFLKGRTRQGQFVQKAGRNSEVASEELCRQLNLLGFNLGSLKYCTAPTVKIGQEALLKLEKQPFDNRPLFCSAATKELKTKQVPSYKAYSPNSQAVFIQPEDRLSQEWYLDGLSVDLSDKQQQEVVNSVEGLANAEIIKFGCSTAYRYLKKGQLSNNLESRLEGLFFAGQVIGCKTYEEAAATGLTAGLNAALKAKKKTLKAMDLANVSREI